MAERVEVLNIDTSESQKSVKELRQQLKALKDTMLSTEQGTEEYNKALQQAADIQHELKEQMEEVNATAMDFGQITGNIVKATGGLIAGFQAAKATMNLFGVENEAVLKSLEKMQNLMAITQALPSIDDGIKAFKRLGLVIKGATAGMSKLKVALASTGIGLAVIAVGALAANWDKVTDAMRRWGIINEDTQKKLEEQKKKVEELQGEIKKLEGSYEEWEKQQKISNLNSDAKKQYEELATALEGYYKQLAIVGEKQKLPENQSRARWEALNAEGQALLENIRLAEKQQQAILDSADSYKVLSEEEKKYIKTQKELAVLLASSIQYISPQSLQQELDKKFEGQALKVPFDFGFEEEDEADTSSADALKEKIVNTIESLRSSFMTPEEQYQQEIDALDVALKTKLIKEEEYLKLRDALNKEQTQNEINRYAVAANAIGGIFNSIGEMMEEGSEEQKAFQIMGATVNMLAGIATAIAGAYTTHTGPWDIALAAIQAAAIAASGGATIAKMVQTNKNNAASMASSTPNTTALTSMAAPVQYTSEVQGASTEGQIEDTRVYVLESDITNTQKKVSTTESEATF